MRSLRVRLGLCVLVAAVLLGGGALVAVSSGAEGGVDPDPMGARFPKGVLAGETSTRVTTLQFGPDGRLYTGQFSGLIKAYTIERRGPGDYAVTAGETLGAVQSLLNHDDDGTPNIEEATRLVTGLLVTGTAEAPVIYVTSSDPRIGGGPEGEDLGGDTNSGVLSRLTRVSGEKWRRVDLVRGLPRSKENHGPNGMALSADGRTLFIAQGGMTNNGAPSAYFAFMPEYALSGAILTVDLAAIGDTTYDLPTLDDATRPGPVDAEDPFGGNRGRNQARLVPDGPVQVWATGFRNAYDLVLTADGRMYTIDNGANPGWGNVPKGEGPAGVCTHAVRPKGPAQPDILHLVTRAGYYGGHPNPTRGNQANRFDGQSPVAVSRALECDHRQGRDAGALATFENSTNGLAEYQGDLLAASLDNRLYRVTLGSDGRVTRTTVLFDDVATVPLDVTVVGDGGPFPGTIWVGDVADGSITVYEPESYRGRR